MSTVLYGDAPSNIPWPAQTVIRRNPGDTDWDTPIVRKTETFSGTTNGSGTYSVTYATAYASTPDVQPQIQSASATDTTSIRITASSTTGFTVLVRNRTDVIGLLPSFANVSSASVSVLVTER